MKKNIILFAFFAAAALAILKWGFANNPPAETSGPGPQKIGVAPVPEKVGPVIPRNWDFQRNGAGYDIFFRGRHVITIVRHANLKVKAFEALGPYISHILTQSGAFLSSEAFKDGRNQAPGYGQKEDPGDGIPVFDTTK